MTAMMTMGDNVLDADARELQDDPAIADRFHLVRVAADGGVGRVYEGVRWEDARRVAIKALHRTLIGDARCRSNMLREARALQAAAHPLVVELLGGGVTSGDVPYLVLEWIDGMSLLDLMEREGPLPLPRVARIMSSLLAGVEVLHRRGVIHADLKPENVMLTRGEHGRESLKLIDLGVASIENKPCARQGEVYGTPGYLAPEVIVGGSPTVASDLYAAGVILFELLTGCAPLDAPDSDRLLVRHLRDLPPRASEYRLGLGAGLDSVLERALAKEAGDRFASAGEFFAELTRHLKLQPEGAPGTVRRARRWRYFSQLVPVPEERTTLAA